MKKQRIKKPVREHLKIFQNMGGNIPSGNFLGIFVFTEKSNLLGGVHEKPI